MTKVPHSEASLPEKYSEGAGPGSTGAEPSPLTKVPFLVKVDRYGSVSGLSRVETLLGTLRIRWVDAPNEAGSFGDSL